MDGSMAHGSFHNEDPSGKALPTRDVLHCSIIDMCYSGFNGSIHFILLHKEAKKVLDMVGAELDG